MNIKNPLIVMSTYIAAGLAVSAISGAGIGIGIVFHGLIVGVAYAPNQSDILFSYTLIGFALVEAIALFGLMMSFLFMYSI